MEDLSEEITVRPRSIKKWHYVEEKVEKHEWTIEISIWKVPYKRDTEELLNKAFEHDWN